MNLDEAKEKIKKYYENGYSRKKMLLVDQALKDFLDSFDELPYDMNNQMKIRIIDADLYGWGKCDWCGGKTKASLKGFTRFCCKECIMKYNSNNADVKNKRETTCVERYGTKQYSKSSIGRESIKRSHDNFSLEKKEDIKNRRISTNLERHGVGNTFQIEGVVRDYSNIPEKLKKTNLERYGVENYTQSDEYKARVRNNYILKYGDNLLNQEWLDASKDIYISTEDLCEKLGICVTTFRNVINKHEDIDRPYFRDSKHEKIIERILDDLGIKYIKNDRSVICPKEIDFFLPDYNVGIEVNGVYWHSEKFKNKNDHLEKTEICASKGIDLLQFWSSEIEKSKEIIKSIIMSKAGMTKRIYARNTKVKIISNDDAKKILTENHIQGYKNQKSSINIALYDGDRVVSIMTFGVPRYNKKYNWELIRFCNILGITVIGGASKMFKYFVNNYLLPEESIISYADRRYSKGNVYNILGFTKIRNNPPGYGYCDNNGRFYSRQKFQKHKLSKILPRFYPDKTEAANMLVNNYNRVWDCGQIVYHFPSLL